MTHQVVDAFRRRFGRIPSLRVHAPGRVNLIGEHTDYNEGWVLPVAIDLGTDVAAATRSDGILRIVSTRLEAEDSVAIDDLRHQEGPVWTRYSRGMASMLLEAGCALHGADLLIDGNLPLESGLSSSASLEMSVGLALTALSGCHLDSRELALLGQRTENEIVGIHGGIMDQLAAVLGRKEHALLIDCRTLEVEPVPLPSGLSIVVIDSGIRRSLEGSAYNMRRSDCELALAKLRALDPDIQALRDVEPQMLNDEAHRLTPIELNRARHVVSEDFRVLQFANALRAGDLQKAGNLMVESHVSLRDNYEVSLPELDTLVSICLDQPGVYGARLTGAGFGGCIVALCQMDLAYEVGGQIIRRYQLERGASGRAYTCRASHGARAWRVEGAA